MAKPLLSDELWGLIEPVLPRWSPSPKGGQPRLDDRKALTGILFRTSKTGIPREDLPCEIGGCGCGMTCWRVRLRDWQADGTWLMKVHKILLDRLRGAGKIDWSKALIDSSFVRAAYGGGATGPSPVDRAKPGSKHHVITDANGIPLESSLTAANVNDIVQLAPLSERDPRGGGEGRPPEEEARRLAGGPGLRLGAAPPGAARDGRRAGAAREGDRRPEGLERTRWPVERTLSWVHQNRRLRIRYERRPEIHQAFLTLACIKICASILFSGFC